MEDIYRCTGRTTRLIDNYIQYMFEYPNDWIEIHDHFKSHKADELIVQKINSRLEAEHNCRLERNNNTYRIYNTRMTGK